MKKNGFTLIELLVTILIIAVLATYSILAYIDSIYEAENKQAKSKLEVINQGYERYLEEFPGQLLTNEAITDAANSAACLTTDLTPSRLIACGYAPKYNFSKLKYNYVTKTASSGCGSGYVYMVAKTDADVGSKYEGNYCAGINAKGYATDGTI